MVVTILLWAPDKRGITGGTGDSAHPALVDKMVQNPEVACWGGFHTVWGWKVIAP